jgi:hypothetical protein
MLGFALLVAAAVVTVVVPELSEDPDANSVGTDAGVER